MLALSYRSVFNIFVYGILAIVILSFITFFIFLGVARNELETAKRYVVDQIDKSGGVNDGSLVNTTIYSRGALTEEQLEEIVNKEFGGRTAGLITLGDLDINYKQGEVDYFGNPTQITISREFFINIGGRKSTEPFMVLKTSNGGSNRGYMNNENNIRYELGDQYLELSR